MSTLLERLVGDQNSLGSPDWKKPQHLLDAIAKRKRSRTSKRAFCPNGTGGGISNTCGKGIGINDSDQDFTGQILAGEKTIETRPSNSLKPYIGKTVGIVRTGKGKATLVGVMKVGEPKFYKTRKEFDADFDKHKVGKDSPHYIGPEGKFGYTLSDVKPVKPRVLSSQGRVARVISKKVKTRGVTVEFDLGGESPENPHESRSDDCGRDDDGRFTSGNKCGGSVDMPKEDPRGRMRYDNGVQTDAARKLYQMGSSEKKLKGLVEKLGGDTANTKADINPPSLNISVADKNGQKLFHIDVENGRARVYPTKDLSESDRRKIKNAASEAFAGKQDDTKIKVFSKASAMKSWEAENASKIKAWEDKYRFSLLLPPHERPKKWERSIDARRKSLVEFAQSRGFCPNGEGNGVTNTCSSTDGPTYSGIKSDSAERLSDGEKPSEILDSLGFTNIRMSSEFDEAVDEPSGILHMIPAVRRSTASSLIAAMESAANRVPEMRGANIAVRTREEHAEEYVAMGMSNAAAVVSQAQATCNMVTGEISVYFDANESLLMKKISHAAGILSTPDPSHAIVHEFAHSLHAEGMRQFIAKSILEETPNPQSDLDHSYVEIAQNILAGKPLSKGQLFSYEFSMQGVIQGLKDDVDASPEMKEAIKTVSRYATTHPLEAIAEYWTSVTLGYRENDKLLDSLCELGHCPVPKQRKAKK